MLIVTSFQGKQDLEMWIFFRNCHFKEKHCLGPVKKRKMNCDLNTSSGTLLPLMHCILLVLFRSQTFPWSLFILGPVGDTSRLNVVTHEWMRFCCIVSFHTASLVYETLPTWIFTPKEWLAVRISEEEAARALRRCLLVTWGACRPTKACWNKHSPLTEIPWWPQVAPGFSLGLGFQATSWNQHLPSVSSQFSPCTIRLLFPWDCREQAHPCSSIPDSDPLVPPHHSVYHLCRSLPVACWWS